MCKLDLKDGFFHIPVDDRFVDFLCIEFPLSKKIARFRVLPFGIKCAPAWFQRLMLELLRMFKAAWKAKFGDDVLVYIDDWGLFAIEHARAAEGFALLIQMLEEMGFRVHPTKRSPPSQIMEYTGLVYNSVEGTVSAPPRKIAKALFVINDCLNTSRTVVHTLDKVSGTLSDLAFVFTHGKSALYPLYDIIARSGAAGLPKSVRKRWIVHLTNDALRSMEWWRHMLVSCPNHACASMHYVSRWFS